MNDDIPKRSRRKRLQEGETPKKQLHPGARHHNDQLHAEKQEQRRRIAEMRCHRVSVPEIARTLGLGISTVYRLLKEAIEQVPVEDVKMFKAQAHGGLDENERLVLQTLAQLQKRMKDGDKSVKIIDVMRAIDSRTRIIEMRCKLEGAFAPQRHEHHGLLGQINMNTVRGMSDEQLRRIQAGDFSALLGGPGGSHRPRDGGAGDPPPDGTAETTGGPH